MLLTNSNQNKISTHVKKMINKTWNKLHR